MTDRSNPDAADREPPDDLDDLLAAYALDAVDDLERQRIDRFLAATGDRPQAARQELARYEDALAAYAGLVDEVEPPAGTWEAIAAATAAPGAADGVLDADAPQVVTAPAAARRRPRQRVRFLAAAVAAAVLVLAGVVGVTILGGDGGNGAGDLTRRFEAAAAAPGARRGMLEGTAGSAAIVVGPDGDAYVDVARLSPVPEGRVYQLWLLDGGVPASLGVVDAAEGSIATFRAPPGSTTVALSIEAAPGAGEPTLPPVAVATLTA